MVQFECQPLRARSIARNLPFRSQAKNPTMILEMLVVGKLTFEIQKYH